MHRDLKQLSIQAISEVATENSKEFAIARIAVLSTRPNSHRIIITDEILRRDGLSVLGKWVVCSFNGFDATTHKPDEVIVGIVPKDAKYEFVETDDGYTVLYVDAIISKLYAKKVYEMFKVDNFRNCSVEMMTADDFELPNGETEISGLEIVGITILGKTVNGSCPDANMSITQFSEVDAENYYKQFSQNENPLELARRLVDLLNEKEFSQDENLLDITNATEEAYMEEKNIELFESAEEKEEDVVMSEEKAEDEKELAENNSQDEEKEDEAKDEKEMAEDSEEKPQEDEEKEMSCGCESKEEMSCGEEMSCDADKEMSQEEEKEDEKKEFSLKENIDIAMFENESEEVKNFIAEFVELGATEIVEQAIRLFSENAELNAEKAKADEEKRDKKFASIMASVKEDLDEKTFSELSEEGKEISLNELGAFENKVKAFAYEYSKNNKKPESEESDIMVFAGNENTNSTEKLDVFERISRA